ncbi:MAG: helix-turn-helix transcriptional regulator [Elusimicrobiota bacterium]
MEHETTAPRLASLLRGLREERGISQRQLGDEAGVDTSMVNRVENGRDARLSTWAKLFEGLGYRLLFETTELCEEAHDLLAEEAERRRERRREGLCAGKRRFY